MKNLIIVESPTKARTLSRFLGTDYIVKATMGHVKDLPKSQMGVDVENNFKPDYIFVEKKKDAVADIVKSAKGADNIFIATDPDREGEAIARHIYEILHEGIETKVGSSKLKRISFHEITQGAVENAISTPGKIDDNLVDAQIARRVLDRLVGYKLSPVLWKKIRRGLSAGRVQTVAVRLIVEREKEIELFKSVEYWEIFCEVKGKRQEVKNFTIKLIKINDKKAEVNNSKEASEIVSDLNKAGYSVSDVKKREVVKSPYPPFTTSTMTQAAARLFFWSAKRTMTIAQKLYEEGLITYHRTDSTNISAKALETVRAYIKKEFGTSYLPEDARIYKTKSKVAQEAHEAIRPTDLNSKVKMPASLAIGQKSKFSRDQEVLYELIWRRFIASQMKDSVYAETVINVIADKKYLLQAAGQIMKFDGWKKLFTKAQEMVELPEVQAGEKLDLIKVTSEQKFTQPPARFNEAMLIKMLEKLGIGRPSTYAPIISTIQIRQYVEKLEGRFKPTSIGIAVNDFLVGYFPDIFEYGFTAKMEDDLDRIANGDVVWTGVIGDFWKPFENKVEIVEKKSKRVQIATEKLGEECPECKKGEKVIRLGRFGKFISCSRFPDCKFTEKYIEKINMKCPLCVQKGLPAGRQGEVIIKTTGKGRKFYGCSNYPDCKFASWKKPIQESDDLKKE